MKHAYLIIAHQKWNQLIMLLQQIDSENNDIYIHIDKKAKNVPIDLIKSSVKKSKIEIYQKYKVYWGSFEIVQSELLLFEEASKQKYDYYHLLSGMDLLIKSQSEIAEFFEKNKGYEFVHFDTEERLKQDNEIKRRTKLYHFLQNYRRRYKIKLFNEIFTFLERLLLVIQIVLHIDRMKKHPEIKVKYGSQWVSITDSLVNYILQKEELIYQIFKYTNCADELFIQTLVYNSEFKEKLFDKNYNDSQLANMRLIDMKKRGNNGNPYTWRYSDSNEIDESQCLFARKFDIDVDEKIIKQICNKG